jgi:hypothetical protein
VWVDVYFYERCTIVSVVLSLLLFYFSQRTAQNLVEDDKKLMFRGTVCSGSFCNESSHNADIEILLMRRG